MAQKSHMKFLTIYTFIEIRYALVHVILCHCAHNLIANPNKILNNLFGLGGGL